MQIIGIICIAYILFNQVFRYKRMVNYFYQFINKIKKPRVYQPDVSLIRLFITLIYLALYILVWHIQNFGRNQNCLGHILNNLPKYNILK